MELGQPYAKVEAGSVVGLKAGTAVLLVGPPAPVGQEPKGASRVVVRVVP